MAGYSINQAHLIHDHSSGRSSTRLHAPPGGASSMGTSFGWGDDEPAPPQKGGRAFVQQTKTPLAESFSPNQFPGSAPSGFAPQHASPVKAPAQFEQEAPGSGGKGFGDTGQACIRLHAPAGGGNSMGTSFGWGDEPTVQQNMSVTRMSPAKPVQGSNAREQAPPSKSGKGIGATVLYKQSPKSDPQPVVIIHIEAPGSRRDNYQIEFQNGTVRYTTEDKLTATEAPAPVQSMSALSVKESGATFSPTYDRAPAHPMMEAQAPPVQPAFSGNAPVGELAVGQKVLYKQTPRSDAQEVLITNIELPSQNGAMRTKTYYQIRFEDGRQRETTVDKFVLK